MRDPRAAAKRRESLRLTNRMTNRQLAVILREASQEAAAAAQAAARRQGIGSATRAAQLRLIAAEQLRISRALWNRTGEVTREGIRAQAELAARHGVDLDELLGLSVRQIPGYAEGMVFSSQRAAEAVMARRHFGYTLSERIFRNGRRGAAAATSIVERGLAQGLSARELAAQVRGFYSPNVPGGQSYSAMRLARTEINNAYLAVQQEQAASKPWNEWMKWELSSSHSRPDSCDDLAGGGDHPREPGLYRPQNVPSRPHPHCLCYATTVTVEPAEFQRRLLAGDYDDWLEEQGLARIGQAA